VDYGKTALNRLIINVRPAIPTVTYAQDPPTLHALLVPI
jgi:hypothetical protein